MAGKTGEVVIIGDGIIGCSIAYHLSELGVTSTVVESCAVASAASGHSGGLLPRTWCDGGPLKELARTSFDLHKKYGAMFDVDYRPLDCLELLANEASERKGKLDSVVPDWLDPKHVLNVAAKGDGSEIAPVHPRKLTTSFLSEAEKRGCKLVIGTVVGLEFSDEERTRVSAVKIEGKESIRCDTLILAMGPWTNRAQDWLPHSLPNIKTIRVHSIVMKPSEPASAHALFIRYKRLSGDSDNFEVHPRCDGTVYMGGLDDSAPLGNSADAVQHDESSVKNIHRVAGKLITALRESEVMSEQASHLPIPPSGTPIIGQLPGYGGQLYIATGHYWGILNSPATGKALAELIICGHSSIDLTPFDPKNFL